MSTDEQAFEDEWEEEVEAQPPDKCPACGGSRFGIYVMGMPMTGGDFFEQLEDRKSTRLNSSHKPISYAVFCLKKKNLIQMSL